MRPFTDYDFDTKYSKFNSDIAEDFFKPCMNNSKQYDRITGFFGSTVMVVIWDALQQFIDNDGHMRLLCSTRISDDDRKAINDGIEAKSSNILVNAMKNELDDIINDPSLFIACRVLSCLIATGILEIKIVTTNYDNIPESHKTMFHDKVGIFYDNYGNIISFGGSMNETYMGLASDGNSETISVYESWDIGRDGIRTIEYKKMFEEIWNKQVTRIKVYDLPEEIKTIFKTYAADSSLPKLLEEITIVKKKKYFLGSKELLGHQKKAFDKWIENNRRGIYKHATGSGKTYSGLYAMKDSLSRGEVPILIVPSVDLQRQWIAEIESVLKDEMDYLLCGGDGKTYFWKDRLYSWTHKGDGRKIVIAVINTAASDDFVQSLSQGSKLFIVIDEVHRAGSKEFRNVFNINSGPRLGLSATPERFRDEEGTACIFNYFDKIVDTFTLEDAIRLDILSKYYYYPHEEILTESETEEWNKLTKRLLYIISRNKTTDLMANDDFLKTVIKRSKIIKNAKNKIHKAVSIINDYYQPGQKWIVYCDDINQLNKLRKEIPKSVDTSVYYSSMEGDRESTLEYFKIHGGLLLSIKCLDEGVNIPATSHALILASSQNPREFIQRRGRVLRKSFGKTYSYIHDILIIPTGESGGPLSIIETELSRAIKFGESAENKESCITRLILIAIENGIDPDTMASDGYESDLDE